MLSRNSTAASAVNQPPMGAAADCPHSAADRGAAANFFAGNHPLLANTTGPNGAAGTPANRSTVLINLPHWANNDEAKALLERIVVDRPKRTSVVTETMSGPGSFGYAGKAANRLRQLFDPFIIDRMDWAYRAGFDTPLFHKRRASVISYADRHGPDALIARVLEAA